LPPNPSFEITPLNRRVGWKPDLRVHNASVVTWYEEIPGIM